DLYATRLAPGKSVRHALADGRGAWVQVARGSVTLNGERLEAGDGVSIEGDGDITLAASKDAEVLLFDMAM
ncbi:pirin family protein, partial [Streptococcus pyogenes]